MINNKVAEPLRACIAVCTLDRVALLLDLLRCLDQVTLSCAFAKVFEILVVDNDSNASACEPLQQLERQSGIAIRYINEPVRGLTSARNRALQEAATADLLVFLDDDETVEFDWFPQLVETLVKTGAQYTIGPVRPVFPNAAPRIFEESGLFHRLEFPNAEELRTGNTGNCCIDLRWLRRKDIKFRAQFNLSGGEDAAFFSEMTSAGAVGRYAAHAVAYEPVSIERLSVSWLLRRRTRVGANTVVQRIALEKLGVSSRLWYVATGCGRLAFGLSMVLLYILFSPHRALKYAASAARGAGFIAGALGINIRGY